MSKIPLSSEDQAKFIEQYISPDVTMDMMERTWQRPSGTLYRWGYQMGLRRPKPKGEVTLALEQVRQYCERLMEAVTPPVIRIKAPRIKAVGEPMEMVLFLTDLHPGRLTASYNEQVFRDRMLMIVDRLSWQVFALRERYYTIRKLH
ncbi:unnamed protein product, partial [marine sediment metagenome]